MPTLHVHFLPRLTTHDELAGSTAVVIDVLRATTTIAHALAAGAKCVIPLLDVEEARRLAATMPTGQALLGGERHGLKIDGFDLGNSPSEYTHDRLAERTLIFTTTNGTRAMDACRQAASVLLGSFVNLHAVVERLRLAENIHILCAGTEDQITREDVLAAGAIVDRLTLAGVAGDTRSNRWTSAALTDQAVVARDAWRAIAPPAAAQVGDWLARELAETCGGRNLVRIGLGSDIADCAAIDHFNIVPTLDVAAWRIALP